ncbi:FAD:protein FMN transferase [Amycolatopsis thailandensis]|uniref:FAD:protein FMN transferase n=1 Tax=Amycolatopsis thailandensis TaxID=589330 RepID=UPI003626D437
MNRTEQVMGLPVSVDVRDGRDHASAIESVFSWLREVDARFSPFKASSEVCRYDRGEMSFSHLSDELRDVLMLCEHYERLSQGAFSARIPGRPLDPNAVTKGWSVQRAADLLHAMGITAFCINAGGDVVTSGETAPGRGWRVGIRHPEQPREVCAVLESFQGAIATSAEYERGSHILDGRTGHPAAGLLSVTVVADDLGRADALATAAFAMGTEGIGWAAEQPGCEVMIIDTQRRVHRSPGLQLLCG